MRGLRQWRWHLDEMYVKINGEVQYFWRGVDHEGEILESYFTKKRDKFAALRFLKKALKRHGRAAAVVTDGLLSYPASMRELGNLDRREMGRWLNNRVEKFALAVPTTRTGDAAVPADEVPAGIRFSSRRPAQPFQFGARLVDRQTYKLRRSAALAEWQSLVA